MHSTCLFDRHQLGTQALAALLELSNLGPQYEMLKFSLRSEQSLSGYKDAGEVTRLVGLWVDGILGCAEGVLRTAYSPVAEVFALFVRSSCAVNRKCDVVEVLARLVQEDDRRGSTELAS